MLIVAMAVVTEVWVHKKHLLFVIASKERLGKRKGIVRESETSQRSAGKKRERTKGENSSN